MKRFWAGAAAVVLAAGAARADRLDRGREELHKIQSTLDQKKREKERADRRSRELRAEVDRISDELSRARRALEQTDERLTENEGKRSAAEARLWASRQSLSEWQDRLAAALADIHRRDVIGAEGGFVRAVHARALVSARTSSLDFALEQHRDVVALRDHLLTIEERLRDLRLDRARDERRIEAARARMHDLQKTTEGRRAVLEREIESLNASARRFEMKVRELIERQKAEEERRAALARRAAPASVSESEIAARWRGRLPRPVAGAVVEKFGRTRNEEVNADVFSNGVKIRTDADAEVRAVLDGEVLYAGPFMNYGRMVLLGHADALHTICAHLGEVRVARGDKVSAGTVLGRSGRDDQGRPVAYFELRVRGAPADPSRWWR